VADLANQFLTHKKLLRDSGELAARTFQRYFHSCELLVTVFQKNRLVSDLASDDFQRLRSEMADRWGPVVLANEIQMVRSAFKYGYDAGLIDNPIRFGPGFRRPSAKVLRQSRASGGLRMFEREELLKAIEAAGPNLKAMILLAANGGLGNSDVGLLPIQAVNLKGGWLDYPRQKTGIDRRIPLWPEAITAIKAALASRSEPNDPQHGDLLFIGPRGEPYIGNHRGYRVAADMTRLLANANLTRKGLSFYSLRRTFQTIAEGARDLVAVQAIMGHAPPANDMAAVYRQRIDDERLQAVTNHVRQWLFSETKTK